MVQATSLNAVIVFFMVIIMGFIWRTLAAKMADRPTGQAMAYIY